MAGVDLTLRTRTKLAALAILAVVALSGMVITVLLRDAEGPFIYEVDILPISPKAGDTLTVTVYCIDTSGVSSAKLSISTNGLQWVEQDMVFYACLCLAGGRWVANFGPVNNNETVRFYVTAFDNSLGRNPADTQTFELHIGQ